MKHTFFKSPAEFRTWLKQNHDKTQELWVGYYKRGSGKPSMTWPESVDQALCFGWIDGIRKRMDEDAYTIRFTPRQAHSTWSAVNVRRVRELTKLGLMQPPGIVVFEQRQPERIGIYSYEQRPEALEAVYEKKFRRNKKAWTYFEAQAAWYRRAATWWITSAKKEETRLKRLATLIEKSAQGKPIAPLTRPARTK